MDVSLNLPIYCSYELDQFSGQRPAEAAGWWAIFGRDRGSTGSSRVYSDPGGAD